MNRSPTSLSTATPPSLDPVALRRWVLALCIIRFDLEQGQTVEECYPPGDSVFSPDHLLLIAFSSFPDSMHHRSSSSIHDSIFSFRFPLGTSSSSSSSSSSDFVYGFVFNRQRLDSRLPRGGEQRSVVVLSRHPFSSVFRPLLQILGPLCFDLGHSAALRLVASHVSSWPSPAASPNPVSLPIGGASLKAHLFGLGPSDLFHDADLFASFRGLLLHLWTLWELMLIGEPLLVVAPTPTLCSEAVLALVSIVAPLHFSVDFRPYFTIHDPDFARLNSLPQGHRFPPMLLGVTNLFFLKALRAIPHVVSVGSPPAASANNKILSPPPPPAGTGRSASTNSPALRPAAGRFSPSSLINAVRMRREGPLSLMTQHKEAVWSSYAPTTKPDTAVLNRLIDVGVSPRVEESMSVVNNEILRRHFLELTTNFLAPFGPYMRATTPSGGASPFVDPPPLPPFHAQEFLSGLATRGPGKFLSKRMRSNWLELYRRFLEGQNFMPWFQKKRAAAEQEQHRLWREARMSAEMQTLISRMSELEIVDSFKAIERHLLEEVQLQQSGDGSVDSTAACQKLKGDLQVVFNALPKDMQQLLLSNSKTAALLQGKSSPAEDTTPKLPGHPVAAETPAPSMLSFLAL